MPIAWYSPFRDEEKVISKAKCSGNGLWAQAGVVWDHCLFITMPTDAFQGSLGLTHHLIHQLQGQVHQEFYASTILQRDLWFKTHKKTLIFDSVYKNHLIVMDFSQWLSGCHGSLKLRFSKFWMLYSNVDGQIGTQSPEQQGAICRQASLCWWGWSSVLWGLLIPTEPAAAPSCSSA